MTIAALAPGFSEDIRKKIAKLFSMILLQSRPDQHCLLCSLDDATTMAIVYHRQSAEADVF
jgi:hypothetical protein